MARRKRYSAEFKREALRRADEPGVTDVLVAEELGINARNLRNWRDAAKRNRENAFPGQGNARDQELMRLKRKLAKVEQERDFLREAAAYFLTLPRSRSEIPVYRSTPHPLSGSLDVPFIEGFTEWLLCLASTSREP
jgi:transposase